MPKKPIQKRYVALAWGTVLLHTAIMTWFWIGAFLVFNGYPEFALQQVAYVVIVVGVHELYGSCPFTVLEIWARKKSGVKDREVETYYGYYIFWKLFHYKASIPFLRRFVILFKILPGISPIILIIQQILS